MAIPVLAVCGAVALAALAAFVLLIERLSACGGDAGSGHALPGSPQLAYCDSNLDLLGLAAPLPLIVVLAVGRGRRRELLWATAIGLVLACTPLLAAFALPDT
jgi:hypothetical protein